MRMLFKKSHYQQKLKKRELKDIQKSVDKVKTKQQLSFFEDDEEDDHQLVKTNNKKADLKAKGKVSLFANKRAKHIEDDDQDQDQYLLNKRKVKNLGKNP